MIARKLVAILADNIKQNEFDQFRININAAMQGPGQFADELYDLYYGMTLYQLALKYKRYHFVSYLATVGFSEHNFGLATIPYIKKFYINLFITEIDGIDILKKFLVIKDEKLLHAFNINSPYKGLTLLQHLLIMQQSDEIIQQVISAGGKMLLDAATDHDTEQNRIASIGTFLHRKMYYEDANDVWVQMLIAAVRIGHQDYFDCALRNCTNLNGYDASGHSALYFASLRNDTESVIILLQKGAISGSASALCNAISHKNIAMIESLLLYGAGMFSDVDAAFNELDVNASHCYVEGMTINNQPVTPGTMGFHAAFFSIDELMDYSRKQDRGDLSKSKLLHINSLKGRLSELAKANKPFKSKAKMALDVLETHSSVSSLSLYAARALKQHQHLYEVDSPTGNMSLLDYLSINNGEDINLMLQFFVQDAQLEAASIILDRIDEINFFRQHLETTLMRDTRLQRALSLASCAGLRISGFLILSYAVTAITLTSLSTCSSGGCLRMAILYSPMQLYGVAGITVGGIAALSVIPPILYLFKFHSRDGAWIYDKQYDLFYAHDHAEIRLAIDALVEIMKSETLSPEMKLCVEKLSQPNIKIADLIDGLNIIHRYYTDIVLKRIYQDKTQTPYQNYNPNRFFFNHETLNAARRNRLPTKLIMDENPETDVNQLLGAGSFTHINNDGDQAPLALFMDDESFEQVLLLR